MVSTRSKMYVFNREFRHLKLYRTLKYKYFEKNITNSISKILRILNSFSEKSN